MRADAIMGLIGDFARGFLIITVVAWIFAIIEFIAIGQTVMAFLFLATLPIPLSLLTYENWKDRKRKRNSSIKCQE